MLWWGYFAVVLCGGLVDGFPHWIQQLRLPRWYSMSKFHKIDQNRVICEGWVSVLKYCVLICIYWSDPGFSVSGFKKKFFLICGRRSDRASPKTSALNLNQIAFESLIVTPECVFVEPLLLIVPKYNPPWKQTSLGKTMSFLRGKLL